MEVCRLLTRAFGWNRYRPLYQTNRWLMQMMVYEYRPLTVTANVSVRKGVALLIEAWSKAGLRDAEIARWFLDAFLTPSRDLCHSASLVSARPLRDTDRCV